MSLVRQVGLLPAGCQPWHADMCSANGDRFAYCATLAVYIYQYDHQYHEFRLHSIMSEHKKTITAISWHPKNPDLLASSSSDNQLIVWNVLEQRLVAKMNNTRTAPSSLGWCPHEKDCLSFVYGRGPLFLWNYTTSGQISTHKEAHNFSFEVCQFRWHPKKMGKLAFGHVDGSLSFFCPGQRLQKHILRPDSIDSNSDEEEDPIVALEWDPLSTEYLLVANTHFGVRLIDSESKAVIMRFQLPSVAAQVHTVAWIGSAPGMFLTGDAHVGVMRLWTVSKSTPIENIKLKKTGFHALHVFSTSSSSSVINSDLMEGPSQNGPCLSPSSGGSRYALPSAHAVCTFLDGGVGLYDLGQRKWNFLRDQGHVETIFDCKFKPDDPDMLATASFDGTIKIWDVDTLSAVHTSPGNEGVIYSLSWAPADLDCVAASTSRNGAFIWDLTKQKIIRRFTEHGKASVFSVAWNQKDSRRIATCGGDSYCIVRQVDGTLIQKYKHPAPVFGCDWSCHNKDMIATGCEDKNVRVYYLATTTDQPLKLFSGHSSKVFHVRWSPLREGILCSGSDDGTIRVWDYTQDSCISVLQGHTAPVRGLLWNPEIPYMLISGSWDYAIRIWDTRDGACIDTVLDHGADVYGLTCHTSRPFVLASCSRDSTVRIWNLAPLIRPLQINILAQRPLSDIIGTSEQAMTAGAPPVLTGRQSKDLKLKLENPQSGILSSMITLFSLFFSIPGGPRNTWELVSVICGDDTNALSDKYKKGIMHMKHLAKVRAGDAQQLEMVKMSKFGAGIGAPSKEERLREAAQIHIKLGNIQRYCELLTELGEWEKALAVAPGVSVDYWKSLAERYSSHLMKMENDDAVPYCVASGNSSRLVAYFTRRGQLQDAMLAAVASSEGSIAPPAPKGRSRSHVNGVEEPELKHADLLKQTSEALADWYFRNGSPSLAACCHLAVNDCRKAISKLLRGNELELAASIMTVLPKLDDLKAVTFELLSRRCEQLGRWDLAVELLKKLPNADDLLVRVCARCAASLSEINDLHYKAGLPSVEECTSLAESMNKGKHTKDVQEVVRYYLLSTTPEIGLQMGLEYIKGHMERSGWRAEAVFGMLQLLGSMRTDKLQQHQCSGLMNELLALSSYVGALVAIRRGYDAIVEPLLRTAKDLLHRENVDLPVSESLIVAEIEAWKCYQTVNMVKGTGQNREANMNLEQQQTVQHLLHKAGTDPWPVEEGPDMVTGSQLPSHSDVHYSCLTSSRIQGMAFFLEDGKSALSINDAIMWAKVNPFSPLGSGMRINPF